MKHLLLSILFLFVSTCQHQSTNNQNSKDLLKSFIDHYDKNNKKIVESKENSDRTIEKAYQLDFAKKIFAEIPEKSIFFVAIIGGEPGTVNIGIAMSEDGNCIYSDLAYRDNPSATAIFNLPFKKMNEKISWNCFQDFLEEMDKINFFFLPDIVELEKEVKCSPPNIYLYVKKGNKTNKVVFESKSKMLDKVELIVKNFLFGCANITTIKNL